MGILVNTGFDVGSSNPIDSRTVKNTTDERDELVTDGLVYENLKVYCKDTQTEYRWTGTEWEEVGTGGTGEEAKPKPLHATQLHHTKITAVSHRGLVYYAPGNSNVSLRLAGEYGFERVEFDICETSDGEFILMHDVTVDATTNGTGNVIDMTLAQVKELVLDTGNFNDGKRGLYSWQSQGKYYLQIPTLQEALDICREFGMIPQIEMKNIVNFDKFLQIITDKGFIENCVITSAHINFLEEIRERNKKVGMRRILQGESNYTDENLEWCAERNIDMDCKTVGLTAEYVNKIHQAGLICNGWIINTEEDLKIAIELGCDSITTDNLTGLDSYQLRAKNNMPHNQITVLKFGIAISPVNDSQKTTNPLTLPSEFKGYDPEVFWRKTVSLDNQNRIQCHNRFDIPAGTTSCKVTVPSGIRTAIVGFNSDGLRIYDSGWINEGVHITGVKNVQPTINDPDTLLTYTISDCAFHVLYSSAPDDGIVNETHMELVKQVKVEYINRRMDNYFYSLSELCSTYGLEVKDYTTKDLMKALPSSVEIKLKHNKPYDAYKITDAPTNYSYIRIVKSADASMNSMELYSTNNVQYSYSYHEHSDTEYGWRKISDIQYNDGYADPSIIVIGDTASADGVIKTLDSLGFTGDVMTWDTGVYRVSHVSGLTNLPSEITSTAPAFRLEHHDCKKWGTNHNPNTSTWAIRHSVLYAEGSSGKGGNVYHRYTESGNTAGTYVTDTGWQKIATQKDLDELFQSVSNGKSLVANAITGKGVSTSTTATFATMATNISKIKGYKEETKSFPVPLTGSTTITSTFSADVIGIKQIILPTDTSRVIPQTTLELFKIEGKNVTMTITGSGTWKVTALIQA